MERTKIFYEKFHGRSKAQNSLISKNDFTYNTLLQILKPYVSRGDQKILDIGCGVGSVDLYLASLHNNVLGIDISAKAIRAAKKSAKHFKLGNQAKFKVLSFPDHTLHDKYDIVICSEVLEHLEDDGSAISTLKKLLKPRGIVIASSPSLNAPLYKLGFLDQFDKRVGHIRRYSEETFRKLFKNNNFKILKMKKTEGLLRNFLFTSTIGGFLLKILKRFPLSSMVAFLDVCTLFLFGESNIYLVSQKK